MKRSNAHLACAVSLGLGAGLREPVVCGLLGPWGAGEPTAAVVPSAIANAVYDAVGVRLRSVPFTPDKVLAGLKA